MLFSRKNKNTKIEDINKIPGIEPEGALAIQELGFNSVSELKMKDAEEMYYRVCIEKGGIADKTLLYQFRCAIYYATVKTADPKKLRWWYWKDSDANDTMVDLSDIYEENS